ncbi:LLM class flavin-dependent oxidoreductase [Agrobacterium vitis]|uniref:LLM class flavin-dependent oxidoreductase n=1 Tax=Rhizobium/Agrobacterium group TaxID=227290 RepID=UPI0012E8C2CF|nr:MULTISPECIES: LLM class flavin-dependent oxidoreductase [Rhizobium/Agrobacterium group]MCF1461923.1 LLM class flavin-dependent oxidoreductase [Allorhizobium ampelinum]MVA51129.1 LLM class flavin-dependent oxidoreductase [Agrobacterium vitis]
MKFSLFYFDGDGSAASGDSYRLLMDSAKFADDNGLSALWVPERHFHAFGGLYPNPSMIHAALAMVTKRVQLRSGSIVLPLHHPVRVAEEIAVVDNLSQGRVGVAIASGWTRNEFVLSREPHGSRRSLMWRSFDQVTKLLAGETLTFEDAEGNTVEAKTLPRPVQPRVPFWVACQSMETFVEAGRRGINVLTALLGETLESLTPKIAAYRRSLEKNGFDPAAGTVSIMVHTYLGGDVETVKANVKGPFSDYLRTHYHLLEGLARSMGLDIALENFSRDDLDSLIEFGVEGFIKGRSLIGTPESTAETVEALGAAGIDEIACLIDFVQDYDLVMGGLPHLARLARQHAPQPTIAQAV